MAKWRAEGECAVGADAVPTDDDGGVFVAEAEDPPQRCAGGGHAFAGAEEQAAQDEEGQSQPGNVEAKGGEQGEDAACAASCESEEDGALGA